MWDVGSILKWLCVSGILVVSAFSADEPFAAQSPTPPTPNQNPAPSVVDTLKKPLAQATTPSAPVRVETVTYDAWTVSCRDTTDGKTKKVCSAALPMDMQQQGRTITLGAWLMARTNEGSLVWLLQIPQIDIGVLIAKGVELKLGNGTPHKLTIVNCNPQHCEATMPMDEASVRDALAAATASASVKFWKTDNQEFTINFQSIKGIDKAIAAVK